MSLSDPIAEKEPFNEPLAPLPKKKDKKSHKKNRPRAVEADMPDQDSGGLEGVVKPGREEPSVLGKLERLDDGDGRESTPVPRWKFWKRPSKREQQLDTLRQGATEMVDLMRSIRDHLEAGGGTIDRDGILKSLSPLPTAVESLKSMSDRQAETGRTLEGLHKTLEQRANRDGLLLRSLNRMGTTMSHVEETFGQLDRTLSGMDQSNQTTARNMELLGDRVADTGQFMNESFAQLRDAEREFTSYISRSTRRSGIAMVAVCSLLVISVLAVAFMFRENRNLLTAVQQNGALVVQVPHDTTKRGSPQSLALIDGQLKQVDDGPGDSDHEAVRKTRDSGVAGSDEIIPVETEGSGFISINKPEPRK